MRILTCVQLRLVKIHPRALVLLSSRRVIMKNKKDKIVRRCHSIVVCCEFRLRNVQSAYNGLLFSVLHQSLPLYLFSLSTTIYLHVPFYFLFE